MEQNQPKYDRKDTRLKSSLVDSPSYRFIGFCEPLKIIAAALAATEIWQLTKENEIKLQCLE